MSTAKVDSTKNGVPLQSTGSGHHLQGLNSLGSLWLILPAQEAWSTQGCLALTQSSCPRPSTRINVWKPDGLVMLLRAPENLPGRFGVR